jgi:nucleotide-binding universal stress UspA family protein
MIKRILLGLGGTRYTSVAIQRAVSLAKRFTAEITGVTMFDVERLTNISTSHISTMPMPAKVVIQRVSLTKDDIEKAISEFKSACAAEGIKYHVKHEEKKAEPFDTIISLARYHDLMILGLRSIFEYDISFEEPKDTLARLVSAGVRPIIAVSDTFRPIRKVLIAYSGSMESAKTMKRFAQMRLWTDVKLKILTFQDSEDKGSRLLFDASEYCAAHGFQVEHEWNHGSPKDYLLPIASYWQADMIVLGNSARNLLIKQALGETSLYVIRNADRPLFLCQ